MFTGKIQNYLWTYFPQRQPEQRSQCSHQATSWTIEKSLLDSRRGQEVCIFSELPRLAMGPIQSNFQWTQETIFKRGIKLRAKFHVVPKYRTSGIILPLPTCLYGTQGNFFFFNLHLSRAQKISPSPTKTGHFLCSN